MGCKCILFFTSLGDVHVLLHMYTGFVCNLESLSIHNEECRHIHYLPRHARLSFGDQQHGLTKTNPIAFKKASGMEGAG